MPTKISHNSDDLDDLDDLAWVSGCPQCIFTVVAGGILTTSTLPNYGPRAPRGSQLSAGTERPKCAPTKGTEKPLNGWNERGSIVPDFTQNILIYPDRHV
eukprot:s636_g4.t1